EAKLLVNLMVVENQIAKIVTATAPYQVLASLEKNIQNYAAAVLLSSKISTYKGAAPQTSSLYEILLKHRFDLPAGIEHNPADFSKVIACAQEALTQKRSKFKKAVRDLFFYQNIFELVHAFVDGTKCSVTHKVYLKDPGQKFWDKVDSNLSAIRKQANGDSKKKSPSKS
ncbi:hypothetical protein B0H10DRAFT_1737180, partial [Mycena sp. CBHHK59/15]